MHCAKKTMQWNKKTMRMDKWTIAMVRFKHRNLFYDTKKWFLSNPPTWIFWRKIKSFYNYILIIYIFYLIGCTFWDTLCPKKWLMSLIAMKRNYLICKFIDQKKSWPMNGAVCGALCGPLLLTYKNPSEESSAFTLIPIIAEKLIDIITLK